MTRPDEPKTRWWRRSRDLANQHLKDVQAQAAMALLDLDAAQADLVDLVSAHKDAASRKARTSSGLDMLVTHWEQVAEVCHLAIDAFYKANSRYDATVDMEELDATALATDFTAAIPLMQEATSQCTRFRAQYDAQLTRARVLVKSAPDAFNKALVALTTAQKDVQRAQSSGATDPSLPVDLARALDVAGKAEQALSQRRWSEATSHAASATAIAKVVSERAVSLDSQAQDLRRSVMSLRTRRDILRTQAERLPPVMSELRRKYKEQAWEKVVGAPERVQAALATVDQGLLALDAALEGVVDVPAASLLLRQARAAASQVDTEVRAAISLLEHLNGVADNPKELLGKIRTESRDARRFVNDLPPHLFSKYAPTFNSFAHRVDALEDVTKEARPDWGYVLREADAITDGLDRMIRTARSEL